MATLEELLDIEGVLRQGLLLRFGPIQPRLESKRK